MSHCVYLTRIREKDHLGDMKRLIFAVLIILPCDGLICDIRMASERHRDDQKTRLKCMYITNCSVSHVEWRRMTPEGEAMIWSYNNPPSVLYTGSRVLTVTRYDGIDHIMYNSFTSGAYTKVYTWLSGHVDGTEYSSYRCSFRYNEYKSHHSATFFLVPKIIAFHDERHIVCILKGYEKIADRNVTVRWIIHDGTRVKTVGDACTGDTRKGTDVLFNDGVRHSFTSQTHRGDLLCTLSTSKNASYMVTGCRAYVESDVIGEAVLGNRVAHIAPELRVSVNMDQRTSTGILLSSATVLIVMILWLLYLRRDSIKRTVFLTYAKLTHRKFVNTVSEQCA